jgi:hypothetical protein
VLKKRLDDAHVRNYQEQDEHSAEQARLTKENDRLREENAALKENTHVCRCGTVIICRANQDCEEADLEVARLTDENAELKADCDRLRAALENEIDIGVALRADLNAAAYFAEGTIDDLGNPHVHSWRRSLGHEPTNPESVAVTESDGGKP